MSTISEILREYLNIYWLRPETALWRTVDALMLSGVPFERPSLDLGCGDGLNSYILRGGHLDSGVDAFLDTTDVSARAFFGGTTDIYNYASKRFPRVAPPPNIFDVGLDWKEDLLRKAARLHVHEKLLCHDSNKPLPFADNSFNSVFSNIVYWIDDLGVILAELRRVITPQGTIHLLLTSDTLKKYMIYTYYEKEGWEWIKNFDMGRYAHAGHYLSAREWSKHFGKAGLKIEKHLTYLSGRLVRISEIGLRPVSPVLIKMANSLSGSKRKEIKKQMVEYLLHLAVPLFESGWIFDKGGPQTYHYYVLSKR